MVLGTRGDVPSLSPPRAPYALEIVHVPSKLSPSARSRRRLSAATRGFSQASLRATPR